MCYKLKNNYLILKYKLQYLLKCQILQEYVVIIILFLKDNNLIEYPNIKK